MRISTNIRTGEEDAGTDAGAPPGAEGKVSVSVGMPSTFTSTIFLRVSLYHFEKILYGTLFLTQKFCIDSP